MPLGGLITGGVVALGAGAEGAITSGNAQNAATQATQQAVSQYLNVLVPDPEEQKIIMQQYQQTGKMDPRLAKAFQQSQSEMSKVTTNPELEDAQMKALSSLENEANNGGHTLQQDSYLNQVQNQVAQENAGREGAIEADFARRGMGSPSGLMLSAKEQNNQNMTTQENQAATSAAAQAQQNALQAIQQEGQQAGNVRNQDFNQAATIAQAKDQINHFNTQMAQGVENQNVNSQNAAQSYNVQQAQKTADQNTGLTNYENQYNKQLQQQQFQNQMSKASGTAGAYMGQAGQDNQNAQQNGNMWGNIAQGALKTGVGAGNIYASSNKPNSTGGSGNSSSGSGNTSSNSQWDPFNMGSLDSGSSW